MEARKVEACNDDDAHDMEYGVQHILWLSLLDVSCLGRLFAVARTGAQGMHYSDTTTNLYGSLSLDIGCDVPNDIWKSVNLKRCLA